MFFRRPQPALKTHIEDPQNFRMKIFNSLSMKASARVEVQYKGQAAAMVNHQIWPTNQPSGNHQIWPRSISAKWDQISILSNFVFSLIVLCVLDPLNCSMYRLQRLESLVTDMSVYQSAIQVGNPRNQSTIQVGNPKNQPTIQVGEPQLNCSYISCICSAVRQGYTAQ